MGVFLNPDVYVFKNENEITVDNVSNIHFFCFCNSVFNYTLGVFHLKFQMKIQ